MTTGTSRGTGRAALALLLFLAAMPARGQGMPPAPPMDSVALARALGELRPGQPIRVALLSARWVGNFDRVAGDTLYFGSAGDLPMGIRFNAIDTLWRRGSDGARWSTAGGVTLGVLFAAAGAFMGNAEGGGARQVMWGAVLGGFLGGGIGSVLGGVLGSRRRVWHRVYP